MINRIKSLNLIKLFHLEKLQKPIIYLLVLSIFIISNILLASFSLRFDLSQNQAYTLSPSTKKIIKKLDDLIVIKFFVSSDLPTRIIPLKTEVIDLLNEYKKINTGKIIIKILDPKKDEKSLNETKEHGIPELQFSQMEKDRFALSTAYFGLLISYADKGEVIPQIGEIENLEYLLTSSVYKLTQKEIPKIGITTGEENLTTLKKIAERQFVFESIDTSKEIDKSIKTLIVFDNNKKKYEENEINNLKMYLDNKGKIIFFVDGVWVNEDLTTSSSENNLFNLINEFGIKVNKDLVLSSSAELVNFGNESVQFFSAYPFWLKTNQFNSSSSYFNNIQQFTFPWISSLEIEKKSGSEIIELIKTTRRSWTQKGPPNNEFILNPQNIPSPKSEELKDFIISAYAKKGNDEIIVIPSSRFIMDRFLNQSSGNIEFVLNILNNFASDGALSGIRSRVIAFYPLPELSDIQKDIFKYSNIFLAPIIFLLYGSFRLIKRK